MKVGEISEARRPGEATGDRVGSPGLEATVRSRGALADWRGSIRRQEPTQYPI